MLDQDLAGIPEVMTILEEKQLVADRLDPRVRYFPTSNVDLCDNVDDRLSTSSSINHFQHRSLWEYQRQGQLLRRADGAQEGNNCNRDRPDQPRLLQRHHPRNQQLCAHREPGKKRMGFYQNGPKLHYIYFRILFFTKLNSKLDFWKLITIWSSNLTFYRSLQEWCNVQPNNESQFKTEYAFRT